MTKKITETSKPTKAKNPARKRAGQATAAKLTKGAEETRAMVEAAAKGKVGRPTKFTPEKWERILQCVASYGDLFEVCAEPDMPAVTTVGDWIRRDDALMDDMRKAWHVFSMIGYSVNNNILRGGVLSTGDKQRDFEIANNNRWHMGKTNRRDFGDKTLVQVEKLDPFVLETWMLPGQVIDVEEDQ